MNKKNLWGALAIVIIVLAISGVLLLKNNSQKLSSNNPNSSEQTQNSSQKTIPAIKSVNITVTDTGFNPQTVTLKAGEQVIWTNKSGKDATVNSDAYPTNLLWPFLNLGIFGNGTSVSVNFATKGKYTYYNYLSQDQKGSVIVE
jgi:plastocyanin